MFVDELLFINSKVGSTIYKPAPFCPFKLETTINLLVNLRGLLFPIENPHSSNQRVAFK